jgi:hypothetical protein
MPEEIGVIKQETIHNHRITFTGRPLDGLVPEESAKKFPMLYHVLVEREPVEGDGNWQLVPKFGYHSFTNKNEARKFYQQCIYTIIGEIHCK